MQITSFLPGMNPYLQVRWPDAYGVDRIYPRSPQRETAE